MYKLTDEALREHPEVINIQSKGHKRDVGSGAFKILNNIIYHQQVPKDHKEYVKILGLVNNNRTFYWADSRYIDGPKSFDKYKVFIPKANGSGAIGEVLSTPLVGAPLVGATESFLSIGEFDDELSAVNCMKYIKTKFSRAMLGILKITQDNTREKWKCVPLQDFTPNSDIDWSKPIPEIDQQLYKKYNLSPEEIDFIETHVKEME